MKTERRHELQKNVLADKLAHGIAVIEPYFRAILGAIIAIVVVVFVWAYLKVRDREWTEKGWDSFFQAFSSADPVDRLSKTADEFSTTKVSQWARLMDADLLLTRGIDQLFTDKSEATKQIRLAAEMYLTVNADSEAKSPVVARARYGQARAHEALGELQKAREEYNAIVQDGGPFAEAAKQRTTDLDRGRTKEFYDWFAKYEPPRPSDKPESKFDFLNESLDRGSGLGLPRTINDLSPIKGPLDGAAPPADGAKGDAPKDDGSTDGPSMPDEPKADAPNADAPAADAPKADAPGAGAPDAQPDAASDNPAPATPTDSKPAAGAPAPKE